MKKSILSCFLLFGTLFVISCKTQKTATTATETACESPVPTYSANVKALIENKCSVNGCHSKGRGDLRVFENLKHEADDGQIKQKVVINKTMPPDQKLSESEIKMVDCWLKDGAKQN